MAGFRHIGDSLREAITWTQDTLGVTRPVAEQVIQSAIAAKQVKWDHGIVLLESDDEMEDRKKAAVQSSQKAVAAFKKMKRRAFRNSSRATAKSIQQVSRQAVGTFSGHAEEMIARGELTLRPLSEDDEFERGK